MHGESVYDDSPCVVPNAASQIEEESILALFSES